MQRIALLCLIVALLSVLTVGCSGGTKKNAGSGDAIRVNVAEAAKSPNARTFRATHWRRVDGACSTHHRYPQAGPRRDSAAIAHSSM